MLDYRPNTEANLGTRALSLLPILGLHFGTHSYSNLAKLSTWQRRMAVVLLIDKSGMPEKLFGHLQDEGIKLGTPRSARDDIRAASLSLVGREVLTAGLSDTHRPGPEDTPVVGEAVDNADVKADGKMHTKLACSSTYLG